MISDLALSAGVEELWIKTPLAMWLILVVMLLVDRRNAVGPVWIICMLVCGLASLRVWPESNAVAGQIWLSRLHLLLIAISGWLGLRAWITSKPQGTHIDDSQASGAAGPAQNVPAFRLLAVSLACTGSLITGSLLIFVHSPLAWGRPEGWLAVFNLLASALAFANVVACGIQLTFYCSPDSIARKSPRAVAWGRLAWLALVVFVAQLLISLFVFLSPTERMGDSPLADVLPRGFALSLVFIQFVSWMVPHRVYGFQRGAPVSGWPSLAISAWIAALTLGVSLALPIDWPWKLLR